MGSVVEIQPQLYKPERPTYYAFPSEHHRSLRTNNPLERIMREIRRRTRVVGAFPDGNSALLLVSVRPRLRAGNRSGAKCWMIMSWLNNSASQAAVGQGRARLRISHLAGPDEEAA